MMSWFRSGWALVVGVSFVGVGLALISSAEKLTFLQKMLFGGLTEIGFAFVIAWVVGQTFERAAKAEYNEYIQEQEKALSQNILRFLFNVDHTKSVFKVVTDHVLSKPLIKDKQLVDYSIVEEHVDTDWLTINCFFDYTLRNISNKDVDKDIRFHFADSDLPKELSGIDTLALGLLTLEIGEEKYDPSQFPDLVDKGSGAAGQLCYSVRRTIKQGETLRVRISLGQLKHATDSETWTTYDTCEELEVNFRYDSTKFNASVEALHPSREFASLQPPTGASGILRARISEPLLPANGFVPWWERQ